MSLRFLIVFLGFAFVPITVLAGGGGGGSLIIMVLIPAKKGTTLGLMFCGLVIFDTF